jgi:hypothetical protein
MASTSRAATIHVSESARTGFEARTYSAETSRIDRAETPHSRLMLGERFAVLNG